MNWEEAVWQAVLRFTKRHRSREFSRQDLLREELAQIVSDTCCGDKTPHHTVSRVLQKLRDQGLIDFVDNDGTYRVR